MQSNKFLSVDDYRKMTNQVIELRNQERKYIKENTTVTSLPQKEKFISKIHMDAI